MKKIMITLALLLASCTGHNPSGSNTPDSNQSDENVPEIAISNVSAGNGVTATGGDLDLPIAALDLGTSSASSRQVRITFKVKNNNSTPQPLVLELANSPGFFVFYNRCGVTLAANASCTVSIAFNNRGLYDGSNYNTTLKLNSLNNIFVHVAVTGAPAPSGVSQLELALTDSFIPLGLSSNRTLSIKNISDSTATNVLLTLPSSYIVRWNHCSTTLKSGDTCLINIGYGDFRHSEPLSADMFFVNADNQPVAAQISSDFAIACEYGKHHSRTGDGSCVTNLKVTQIENSWYDTCALMEDHSVQCAGLNGNGQLGLGTKTQVYTPRTIPAFNNAKQIAMGFANTCVLFMDGTVKCVGFNDQGSLGVGDLIERLTPTIVPEFQGAKSIVAGVFHTCAIMGDDSVRCTGFNASGQLGFSDKVNRMTPETNLFTSVKSLSLGYHNTCAMHFNGDVECVKGDGNYATLVPEFKNALMISSAHAQTCAVIDGNGGPNKVRCIGNNNDGIYGNGTAGVNDYANATEISQFSGAKYIHAGHDFTCGLMNDNTVKCTGYGIRLFGFDASTSPVPLYNGLFNGFTSMSGKYQLACVIGQDGSVRCSGYGPYFGMPMASSNIPVLTTFY